MAKAATVKINYRENQSRENQSPQKLISIRHNTLFVYIKI